MCIYYLVAIGQISYQHASIVVVLPTSEAELHPKGVVEQSKFFSQSCKFLRYQQGLL